MKPADYLASLRQEAAPQWAIDQLPPPIKRQVESLGLDAQEILRKVNTIDFGQYLYSQLHPRLPPELRELFTEGYIAVGALHDDSPNAFVKHLGDDGYAIVFHTGLKDFLYRLARVLSTRFFPSLGVQADRQAEAPPLHETARIVAEVFWWYQETGRTFGPSYEITDQQIQVASMLATEAELFLLAHEIGHIIADAGLDSEFSERITGFSVAAGDYDEHAADAIAFRLVMQIHGPQSQLKPSLVQLRYAGVEFALRVFATLERLGFTFDSTHPAAGRRLDFIRAEVRRLVPDEQAWTSLSVLARGVEALFDEMAKIIEDPGEHESFYVRSAESVVARLTELLDKCTGGMVPDYVGFWMMAGEIFGEGYSHRMLSEIAVVASQFFRDVTEMRHDSNARVNFQKFKLFRSFIDGYTTEPARSLFLRQFQDVKMEPS